MPEFIDLLKKLADTGRVEFLAETYAHSLSSLIDPDEFANQVKVHDEKIHELFGQHPKVLRNTELIYCDELAPQILAMGYKGVITEGAKHILGWKSPNYVYSAASAPKLKLLLKNSKLSDDISFRFSNPEWDAYPLTADKYIDWIASTPQEEQIINLFMNLETFGEMQPRETGIFQFLEALPNFARERGIEFFTPTEAVTKLKPVGELSILHPISWADEARDTSAWLGNKLQREAFDKLYSVAERVRLCDDRRLKQDWYYLQASDHFFYMATKHFADGAVHSHFSPYETPFQAFTNYMNALADFIAAGEVTLDAVASRCADPAIADDLKYVLATANAMAAGRYQVAYCPSLVRGQGYYTGMVFEITCPQFSGAVAGGGRYDNMVGKFLGTQVPAVGFSIGFERVCGILLEQGYQIPGAKQKIALLYGRDADFTAVLSRAAALRETYNVTVLPQGKKLGKQLGQLEAAGFAGAAFMDKDEVKIFAQQ